MGRIPIPPKLRWQVYARDGFRCRYCGAQPPDVALVVDHAHPVARGGRNNLDNLITSCELCNQGKSDSKVALISEWRERAEALDGVMGWIEADWFDASHADFPLNERTYLYLITNCRDYQMLLRVLREVGRKLRHEELISDDPGDVCRLICGYVDGVNEGLDDLSACALAWTPERITAIYNGVWIGQPWYRPTGGRA